MKPQRQTNTGSASDKPQTPKKPRRSSSKTNGKASLVTYEYAPIGIVECSPDGNHINVNEEFCHLLGYKREELIGKSLKDITHEDDYPIDIKLHQQLVNGQIPFYRLEKRYLHKDGGSIWAELTRSVVRDAAGTPLYTIGVVLDISDRKQVERVLRESTERLRLATEAAQMFTWELDLKTNIYTFADNFERVLGFSGGLLPKNSMETVHKLSPAEDVQLILDTFAKAIEQRGDLRALQYRMIDPESGRTVWVEANAKIVYDETGSAERMFGVTQNITEKKNAQEEILIISRMPEENPNPVMRIASDGRILYANSAASETLLNSWPQSGDSAMSDELKTYAAEAFNSGTKKEVEIIEDGKVFSATLAPVPEAGYVNLYGSDITEQKRAEELERNAAANLLAIAEANAKFRAFFDQGSYFAGVMNVDGTLVEANRISLDFCGFTREDVIGKKFWDCGWWSPSPELQEMVRGGIAQAAEGNLFRTESAYFIADGSERFVDLIIAPVKDENGHLLFLVPTGTDITERKQAEEKLRQQAEVLEWAHVLIRDMDSRIISWNKGVEQLYGWTKEEALGKVSHELFQTKFPVSFEAMQEKLLRTGEWKGELEHIKRDGTSLVVLSHQVIHRDTAGNPVAILEDNSDITERKRIERQQEALYQLTDRMQRINSLDDMFDAALDAILDALHCDRASILLFDEQDVMSFVAWRGLSESYRKMTNGHSPWTPDAVNPAPICMNDVETADLSESLRATIREEGIGALAFIPLVSNGKLIGKFMTYYNAPHVFEEAEIDLSLTIARQFALGVDRRRAEEAVRASEEKYRRIVETANEGIWEIDGDTNTTFVNARMAEMLGYRVDDMFGRSSFEFTFPEDQLMSEDRLAIAKRGDLPQSSEFRFRRKDGTALWSLVSSSPQLDEKGNFLGSIAMIVDITERRRIEQQLARERELLQRLFETMPVLVSLYDAETKTMRLNGEFERLLGWRSDEVTVLSLLESLYPDPDYRAQILQRMATAGRNDWVEVQVQARDGRRLDSLWSNISISEGDQLVTGIALGIDISERKRSEEALRQAALFNETVMSNMGEGLYTVDSEGKVTSMNPAAEKMFGWTLDELRGRRMHDVTHYKHPDGTPFPAEECAGFQVLHHGHKLVGYEDIFIRKDGTFFDVIYSSSPLWQDEKITGLVVVFSDNTTRKQAEKRLTLLSEISELVRKLEDPDELMFTVSTAVGEYLDAKRCLFNEIDLANDREIVHRDYVNGVESVAGIHRISDYSNVTSKEMASGKTVVNYDSKTDPRTAADYERSYLEHGERAYMTVPLMRNNRWVASLWVSDNKPRDWSEEDVSALETIAERTWLAVEKLRINRELYDSEERLRVTFDTAVVGFATLALDMRFLEVNDAFCRIVGYSREELLQMDSSVLTHPDDLESTNNEVTQLIEKNISSFELEKIYIRKDGTRIWVQNSVSLVRDVNDRPLHLIAICQDISERKHAEEALQTSERRFREIFETAGVSVWLEDFTEVKKAIDELRAQGVEDFRSYFLKHPEFVQQTIDSVQVLDVNSETLALFRAKDKQELLGSLSSVFAPETAHIFVEELMALAEGRETLRAETQVRSLDGHAISVWFTVHFAAANGDQSHVVVTLTDITERKRAEEALRIENERFSRFVNSNIVGIIIADPSGKILLANDYYLRLLGVTRQDFLDGKVDWRKYTPPEWLPADEKAIRELRETGVCEPYEKEYIRDDGTRVSVYLADAMLPGAGEEIAAFVLDLTERKQAEESLRASEELYRTIARSIPGGGVYVVDKDMRYIVADGAVTKAFGLSREILEGHTVSDVFEGDQRDRMIERLTQNFAGETVSYETEHKGRFYWTQQAPLVESIGEAIIVTLDITERKQMEQALRQSEERFAQFMEHLPGLAWIKDLEGRYVYANVAAEKAFNTSREMLYGKTDQDIFLPEIAAQFGNNDELALLDEKGIQVVETLPQGDGIVHYSLVTKFPIPGPDGKNALIAGTAFDITDRRKAEEALRESEERYRNLFDLVPIAVYTCDARGLIQEYNHSAIELWGREPARHDASEKYSGAWKMYFPDGRFMPHEICPMARVLRGDTLEASEREILVERPDGTRRSVLAHPFPIKNQRGEIVEAINCLYDITERKQAEDALQSLNLQLETRVIMRTAELQEANTALQDSRKRLQFLSQRLVEVQEEERRAIARELHDRVGQTLSALNINMIIMRDQLSEDSRERVGPRLNDSMHLVAETITLVRDVMSNLRPAVLDDYGLAAALQSHVDEYRSRYGIEVILEKPTQPLPRLGPSIEMTFLRIAQEALMNIARHANASRVVLSLWQKGASVCMTIQDNGTGIASWEHANRPGSHGLTIMRERAEAFGGSLHVASTPGQGTKIEMSIPIEKSDPNHIQKEVNE